MKRTLQLLWRDERAVLSFEWTLLTVLVVFGIVGGLAAGRDVILDELGDLSAAVLRFDQTFSYSGIDHLGIPGSSYADALGTVQDCSRQAPGSIGLPGQDDNPGG
jgi:Flp pilus assembly pilin Flp